MIRLALRMLTGDRLKYFGLLAGMAFAAMMIAQQASIFFGLKAQTGGFIREMPSVDLWVMDEQVRFSEDDKPLPDTAAQRVKGIDGVDWAVPLYKAWQRARLADGTRLQVVLVGVDDATLVGAPAQMVEGSTLDLRRDPGVIIDVRDAATKLRLERSNGGPLKMGDSFNINDSDARVVGMYSATPSFFWDPVIYTTYSRAVSMAPAERQVMSFVLVKVRAGADIETVKRLITKTTGYTARTGPEFESVTASYILKSTGILVNFGMAVGLGFIIGLLVTGQTFFNFTLDNTRYFAALKAMGATATTLIGMVVAQVLTVSLLSFGIGVGVAAVVGTIISKTDLAFLMPWYVVVFTLVSMLVVGLASAVLSLAKVLRLEPGIVFRT